MITPHQIIAALQSGPCIVAERHHDITI